MIGYVMVGTNDLDNAVKYYDALFDSLGIPRVMEVDNYFVAWAPATDAPGFTVTIPFNKEKATVGNGVMVALPMDSIDQLKSFHAKALALGGSNEGDPGFRNEEGERSEEADSGFYAAYFRDLDGNKLGVFHIVK